MFKQILDLITQVITLGRETQRNADDIKAMKSDQARLEKQVTDLTLLVQRLGFEIQRIKENEAQERRIFQLEMKQAIERMERRLPSGNGDPSGQGVGRCATSPTPNAQRPTPI